MSDVRLTGGCQCGAVRYALHSQPARPAICHCRMCQKAAGNLFGSFAGVPSEDFEETRGKFSWWVSSSGGERGFCPNCGTPLAWRNPRAHLDVGDDRLARSPRAGEADLPVRPRGR